MERGLAWSLRRGCSVKGQSAVEAKTAAGRRAMTWPTGGMAGWCIHCKAPDPWRLQNGPEILPCMICLQTPPALPVHGRLPAISGQECRCCSNTASYLEQFICQQNSLRVPSADLPSRAVDRADVGEASLLRDAIANEKAAGLCSYVNVEGSR